MSTRRTVGKPLSLRNGSRGGVDTWLGLHFPRLAAVANRLVLRLSPTSRIRQTLLSRAVVAVYRLFNTTREINTRVFSPDVVLIEPDDVFLAGAEGVSRGPDAVLRSLTKFTEIWDGFRIEPEEMFDLGDQIVLFLRFRGRAHVSGVPLDQRLAYVMTIRAGRITRLQVYPHRPEALEAVGLQGIRPETEL